MAQLWKTYKSSLILLGAMILGGVVGAIWGEGASVLQPVADLFLNLLYCCVVPFIFCSLVAAVTKMTDLAKLKKILIIFIVAVFITGIIACLFMVVPCLITDPAEGYVLGAAEEVTDLSSSLNVLGMFTVSDFSALLSRKNLLALIVFAMIFSFGTIRAGEKGKKITEAMDAATAVIVKVLGIVMKLAPIGLGCYFAILIGQYGSEVVGPMGKAVLMYLIITIVYFVVSQTVYAYIGAGMPGVKKWWATCVAPTLTALGTCSSAATLPTNMIQAQEIGIPAEVADVAIPLGANLHKDGSCSIQIIKVAFLCSVFGVSYATVGNIFMSIFVAVISGVVMGGIPAGGYVAEIFIMSAFGFPNAAIPIMVLIGTITDAVSTAVNVTGDTGLAMVIARFVEGKDWFQKAQEAKQKAAAEVQD